MSSIKITRALRKAIIGDCHESASAMLAAIPDSVIAALSSSQLAEMLDAAWRLSCTAKAIAEREAIANGGVWDERRQAFREIV